MGIDQSAHTHPIPIPVGIPVGIPVPTAALLLNIHYNSPTCYFCTFVAFIFRETDAKNLNVIQVQCAQFSGWVYWRQNS